MAAELQWCATVGWLPTQSIWRDDIFFSLTKMRYHRNPFREFWKCSEIPPEAHFINHDSTVFQIRWKFVSLLLHSLRTYPTNIYTGHDSPDWCDMWKIVTIRWLEFRWEQYVFSIEFDLWCKFGSQIDPRSPLLWRHNGHDGVSNHQPNDCLLNRLFTRRSKKTPKLRATGLQSCPPLHASNYIP